MKHIYPIGDIRPHFGSPDCECKPSLTAEQEEVVAQHHAFDGRPAPGGEGGKSWNPNLVEDKKETGFVVDVEVLLGFRCLEHKHYIDETGAHIADPPIFIELQLPAED